MRKVRVGTAAPYDVLIGENLTPETVRTSSAPLMEKDFPLAKLYSIGTEQDEITATLDRAEIDRISATYRPWYNAHCEIATGPYPGIVEAVRDLRNLGIRTSVVSNKPDAAVQKLSEQYFPGLFDFSIGEQEPLFRRKPAPDMVLAAAQKLGCSLEDSVYVGDSEIDLETARACGMDFLCVTWGFRTPPRRRRSFFRTIKSRFSILFRCRSGAGLPGLVSVASEAKLW